MRTNKGIFVSNMVILCVLAVLGLEVVNNTRKLGALINILLDNVEDMNPRSYYDLFVLLNRRANSKLN